MATITLYDLDCKGRRACWSPNTWKIRYVLNLKNLDYDTIWLELPDIGPTMQTLGVSPEVGRHCTCPTIVLGSKAIVDSLPIVRALEAAYPTPSLHLDGSIISEVETLQGELMKAIGPIALPRVVRETLKDKSAAFKGDGFKDATGMSLDQFERRMGGEAAWTRLQEPLGRLAGLLMKRDGPFLLGHDVSYADFVVASFLQACQRIGQGDVCARVCAMHDVFGTLMEATAEWAVRDDH